MENVAVMQKIVVLNSKGGSGKTTIATNLAAYYAARGMSVALMDMDPQGSSMRWLKVRPRGVPQIHAIAAYEKPMGVTRAFALRTPPGTERLIVDTPAAIPAQQLPEIVRDASASSCRYCRRGDIIHAASRCTQTCCSSPRCNGRKSGS
jgi:chromosome partitioning protein